MSIIIEFLASTFGKWLVILSLIGTTYTTGYIKGMSHEQESQKIAETKLLIKTKTITNVVEKEVVKKIDNIKIQYIPIDSEINQYVKLNPNSNTGIDPDFIRLFQYSTTNPSTRSSTNINEANSKSEKVTTGTLIEIINDNNKLYYECKVIVEEWQDFYSKLQREYNK